MIEENPESSEDTRVNFLETLEFWEVDVCDHLDDQLSECGENFVIVVFTDSEVDIISSDDLLEKQAYLLCEFVFTFVDILSCFLGNKWVPQLQKSD